MIIRADLPTTFLVDLFVGVAVLLILLGLPSAGSARLQLDLNSPTLAKMPIAIPDFTSPSPGPLNGRDLAQIVRQDLSLTALFHIVESPAAAPVDPGGEPDFKAWAQRGAQAVIFGNFHVQGDELVLEARLYDAALGRQEIGKRYRAKVGDHRRMIHRFCDQVMAKLTAVPGCFSTQIAFVGDTRNREIFTMDFDGHYLRQVTRLGSIIMSPDWSPDGQSLIFTCYAKGNPDLWWADLFGGREGVISARPGINASARYSPRGDTIALSLSFKGIPKIFLISPQGNIIKRLTTGRGNDISPTWSPDGSTIAYVSDQAGTPQIYTVPVAGSPPVPGAPPTGARIGRLTFGSNYNTDPDWSPRGDLLTFTARVDGRFQICTIRADGSDFRVLTNQGSNQDPAWSPDGRMIAFSSDRTGKRLIYIMDALGEIQVPVSPITGKAPAWSPRLTR
jgi:TolB protein